MARDEEPPASAASASASEPGCHYVAENWWSSRPLRVRREGPVVLEVLSGRASVVIEDGPVAEAELTTEEAVVSGFVHPQDLPLHPARPLLLASIFVPRRELSWDGAAGGFIRFHAEPPPELALQALATGRQPCDVLTLLDATSVDPFVLTEGRGLDQRVELDRPVDVRAEPEAAIAGTLGGAGRLAATLVERRGERARVVARVLNGFVVGWVDASSVHAALSPPAQGGFGSGGMGRARPTHTSIRCPRDVPLHLADEEGELVVGRVTAGAPMLVDESEDENILVELRTVRLVGSAVLFVSPQDLAECETVAAELP